LERPGVGYAYVELYSLYKRLIEDPFHDLVIARPQLFRNGHVLDIGANVGYTTRVFARAADPGYRVYAFEPDPLNYRLLVRAVARRGAALARVVPVQAAVGDHVDTVELLLSETHGADHRILTDTLRESRPAGTRVTVPLITVDAFTRKEAISESIAFVKIDVQGYEPAVWAGMRETAARSPQAAIAVEYAPIHLRQLGFDPLALFCDLSDAGYRLEIWRRGRRPRPVRPFDLPLVVGADGYADVLAIPVAHES
jgi:FkbM family methyltransferase